MRRGRVAPHGPRGGFARRHAAYFVKPYGGGHPADAGEAPACNARRMSFRFPPERHRSAAMGRWPRTNASRRALPALLVAALLSLAGWSAPTAFGEEQAAPPPVTHDVLVLIDVTRSMLSDQGDGPVWPAVSASLIDLVERLAPGTNVALVPFDTGPDLRLAYPSAVDGSVGRAVIDHGVAEELRTHIAALPVDGRGTHIFESVEFALGQLRLWRDETPDITRVQTLVLYTDGEDTGPHAAGGAAALAALVAAAQEEGTPLAVIYHDVESLLSAEDVRVLEAAGVQVTSVTALPLVALETAVIDLGRLEAGTSVALELRLTSAFADAFGRNVEVSLEGFEDASVTAVRSTLSPAMTVELSLGAEAQAGEGSGRVRLHPVEGDFSIAPRDYVTLTFDVIAAPAPSEAGQAAPAPVPAVVDPVEPRSESRRWSAGPLFAAAFAAPFGLGLAFVIFVWIRRRRAHPRRATFHRLLIGDGAPPTSILDPEAQLIAFTDDEPGWSRQSDGRARLNEHDPGRAVLLAQVEIELRNGDLWVLPRNRPLFVEGKPVSEAGYLLHSGESFCAGELGVRYDRCEIR